MEFWLHEAMVFNAHKDYILNSRISSYGGDAVCLPIITGNMLNLSRNIMCQNGSAPQTDNFNSHFMTINQSRR